MSRPDGTARLARLARLATRAALTVVVYLAALTDALSLGSLVEMYGLIWPPAGVAVASLLLAPRRWWSALLGALFATQVVCDLIRYDAELVPSVLLVAGWIPVAERAAGEVAAILGALLLASVAVFALGDHLFAAVIDDVMLFPVVWAALRLRLSGAAIAILLTTNAALLGTVLGRGPYAAAPITAVESAALLRVFMVVVSVAALLIASRA